MTGDVPPLPLRGRPVEDAAVKFVIEFERRAGREAVDRRYEAAFSGDLESTGRVIEIKATATSYRGWFLPLEPVQFEHAGIDPQFYLYVVENVGQGDPARFTLRVLDPEHLARLRERATPRTYYEMAWSTKDYDATPVEPLAAPEGGNAWTVDRASTPSSSGT